MQEVAYKDHEILLCSQKLREGKWLPHAFAVKFTGDRVAGKNILDPQNRRYPTRSDADRIALKLAKAWIDSMA